MQVQCTGLHPRTTLCTSHFWLQVFFFGCPNIGHNREPTRHLSHHPGNGGHQTHLGGPVISGGCEHETKPSSSLSQTDRPEVQFMWLLKQSWSFTGGPLNGSTFFDWLSFLPHSTDPSLTCSLGPHLAIQVLTCTSLSQPLFSRKPRLKWCWI